ncbi:helix-turn-helix domain-containing protein [Sediminivirga luteola]|uniref:helix-turn-helix domain-containing protein n=1 Tax=Sediminivirga luteola TaxID=1774748 RepID=UPI00241217D1|nr:helix-turn-helix transcriptional regulator [Sediminivirga luteola]
MCSTSTSARPRPGASYRCCRKNSPDPGPADRELTEFGEHVHGWRIVLELTAQQVAERAGITRDTLRRIEKGDSSVGFGNVAQVLRAPGVLEGEIAMMAEPIEPRLESLRAAARTRK